MIASIPGPGPRLRAKYCLALRSPVSRRSAVDALVDLAQPQERLRKELKSRLRSAADDSPETTALLRLCDAWGVKALKVALAVLARKRDFGGLLVLTALVYHDLRFLDEKLDHICSMIAEEDPATVDKLRGQLTWDIGPERLILLGDVLRESTVPDVRHGVCLGLSFGFWSSRYEWPPLPSQEDIWIAEAYANRLVPGLVTLLRSQRASSSRVAREVNLSA
ncbi:hypothetical protein V1634_10845 [Plantactinospora veratri]|uniref:Uncharacterized protein n=1 Tax=Plantactinospora veratri TaxID=1436122 RepID=A0ABU7SBK2_9ACTN